MKVPLTLTVNGVAYPLEVEPGTTLLRAVREHVGLTGAKEGCDDSECGACMMLLDNRPVNACSYLALQAEGVIGDIKHYAVNDQENGRNFVNVRIGKRAIRESDLLAFEIGVKESGVGAVMCSYNRVNGTYACENKWLLTDVLRGAFGFRGYVMSDWGATHSTVPSALAGLDQESGWPFDDAAFYGPTLKAAIASGQVPPARLDEMASRILRSA